MSRDEQEIRELLATWFAATKAGDTSTVLDLMADDVLFLRPGQPVMHKDEFIKAAHQQTGQKLKIAGSSEIQELCIFEDWAYMWSKITVVMTLADNGRPLRRSGDTLSIFRKHMGKWVLARDANMLVEVPDY